MKKRLYIIYDGRAIDNTNEAAVMVSCDSLKEARSYKGDYGINCVIWSYRCTGKWKKGRELLDDERFEEIL